MSSNNLEKKTTSVHIKEIKSNKVQSPCGRTALWECQLATFMEAIVGTAIVHPDLLTGLLGELLLTERIPLGWTGITWPRYTNHSGSRPQAMTGSHWSTMPGLWPQGETTLWVNSCSSFLWIGPCLGFPKDTLHPCSTLSSILLLSLPFWEAPNPTHPNPCLRLCF